MSGVDLDGTGKPIHAIRKGAADALTLCRKSMVE